MLLSSLSNPFASVTSKSVATRQLRTIRRKHAALEQVSDEELRALSRALQYGARSGRSFGSLLTEAFAVLCEVTRRIHGMVPYDVQMLGGIHLCSRKIVEMATGEGKTLTALMPLYLRSLTGKGVLLATANDYLAARDAEFARPVFEFLGMTVGAITEASEDEERRTAYACDVTYGTAVQFGFDFLRDRAKRRFNQQADQGRQQMPVGRGELHAVLVDEADSLLIDEAATPLLIAGAPPPVSPEKQHAYRWAAQLAEECREGLHYDCDRIGGRPELTGWGRKWVQKQILRSIHSKLSLLDYYEFIERAIQVQRDFLLNRDYIIREGEIELVDQGTGRVGKGRQWSEGIHQAIQAKESIEITEPSGHLAKVTVQSFFLAFEHISGMTGTGKQAQSELRHNYKLGVLEIPTRFPLQRDELAAIACPDYPEWLEAIRVDCVNMQRAGRSVLVGARNVAHSEMISDYLQKHGIANQLLNARLDAVEAEIIGQAGQPRRVTVATNMAGRGTDIKLHPEVLQSGGLHVILAGIHPSKRIDRQLVGRAGRRGEPGSHRKIICLQDDLLDDAFKPEGAMSLRRKLENRFSESQCLDLFEKAQRAIASRDRTNRLSMFENEKKSLRYLHQAGLDPLLDIPG